MIRLFCIPHAGGSADIFGKWKRHLRPGVELFPIELAGRGRRVDEPLYKCFSEAVDDVFRVVQENAGQQPYAVFGHSMGSWIAYELYYKMISAGLHKPEHIFFSGRHAPHMKKDRNLLLRLQNDEFLQQVNGTTGSSDWDNDKIPALRALIADFKIIEGYAFTPGLEPIDCRISILGGKKDNMIDCDELREWLSYSSQSAELFQYEGGHFFCYSELRSVMSMINEQLITN
ncbi:thioesterase [Paenibacillus sp. HN-1]|uniref:thioesterase II family protein n=1 Tax=Paenibacillus TaxID=44249 RepID=UPI001CA7D78E|nr:MULTISPECIES: thioesterase domain-containing protein [Paenibacillus]MBY9080751.1 thioesterase [Paenibacillus sp. CGMCC 1.18879]MBY9085257.1 thioesterase [Paenibacillus sinensis]